jgi:CARDB
MEDNVFEEYPSWRMPDLAVTDLAVDAPTAAPGSTVTVRVRIGNLGTAPTAPARVVLSANDAQIAARNIEALLPGQQVELKIRWRVSLTGRVLVEARLQIAPEAFDADTDNNVASTVLRVEDGANVPELEYDLTFDGSAPRPRRSVTLVVRNPSLSTIRAVPVNVYADGRHLRALTGRQTLVTVGPGEEQHVQFSLPELDPGRHHFVVHLVPPQDLPLRWLQCVKCWDVVVPDRTVLLDGVQKDQWVSMGPRQVLNDPDVSGGRIPHGSVGRIDAIAFHPTDPGTLFAGAPSGGIWKSIDHGGHWIPLGDRLPSLRVMSIALDPIDGDIVYLGTGSSLYKGGAGIFKSVDGGTSWSLLTDAAVGPAGSTMPIQGVSRLVVRRVGGTAVVFAATNVGIVRYQGADPRELVSAPSAWVQSRSGVATDVVVHPTNASLVYCSVSGEGIVRTTSGLTALQADWATLSGPVDLTGTTGSSFTLDVFWGSPRTVLAGLTSPRPGSAFGLYRTPDEGGSWDSEEYAANTLEGPSNPFVRVHPADRDLVYFGGAKLYKKRWAGTGQTIVTGVHDDMHGFEFEPTAPNAYLVTGDGGIFRGTIAKGALPDTCTPRNLDLRVTQFYDIDAASSDSALMVGGTQDNGTVLFEGTSDWRLIKSGDGLFSCIAPSNNDVFYAQHQSLDSTVRSADGGRTWVAASQGLPKGFTMMDSLIVVHPLNADEVLSQGYQVYATQNGGTTWAPRGPVGSNVKGRITRVLVQPTTMDWVAGNDHGQVWLTSYGGSPWHLVFDHPEHAPVLSMAFAPTDHRLLYVLFGGRDYLRIWRLTLNPGPPDTWDLSNITDNFPSGRDPLVIAGDGHHPGIVYVGTDKGVYAWTDGKPTYDSWRDYSLGLPLVQINDLLTDPTSRNLRAGTWGRGAWAVVTGP